MNKLMTKIVGATLGLAMAIGVGVGVANNNNAKEVNAENISCAMTGNANVTVKEENDSTGDSVQAGKKMNKGASGTITVPAAAGSTTLYYHAVAWNGEAQTISLSCTNATLSKNSQAITANTNVAGSGTTYVIGSFANYAFSVDLTQTTAADMVLTLTAASNKRFVIFYAYYVDNGGQQGPVSLTNPNPQYNDTTKKVTWTTDAHATKYQIKVDSAENFEDIGITPNPEYDASGLTTSVQHTVQIKAVGDETNYSSTTGSVQFTPTAPFVGKEYALCTSVNDLEAGAKYIFTSGKSGNVQAMSTENNANNRRATGVSVDGTTHRVTSTQQTLVVELGGTEDHWTFETTNYLGTDGYFASSGSSNYLKVQSTAGEATISFTNSYAVINLGPSTTNKLVRYNEGSTLFSCYASGQQPVYLWKEYKELTGLNVTGVPSKLTGYYDSEKFDPTGITAYEAVYSDSSTRAVSASEIKWPDLVANMGKIKGSFTEFGTTVYTPEYDIAVAADVLSTISLNGTMQQSYYLDGTWDQGSLSVTANYASGKSNDVTNEATIAYYSDSAMNNQIAAPGDLGVVNNQTIYVKATYNAVSNTIGYVQTISVSVEPGTTLDNPLTVAQAVVIGNSLAHNTETSKEYYIQGTVSEIDSNSLDNENDRWVTFWLQNGETSKGFEVYHIAPAEGCTNYSDMRTGAEVLIKCAIKRYNSTIETGSTKSLLSIAYTTPALESISLNKTSILLGNSENSQIEATLMPLGAEAILTWISSDDSVVTVDQNGNVSAVSNGSATITAFVDENSNSVVDVGEKNAICSIEVFDKAIMKYESTETTNMAASNNATLVNLDENVFSVDAEKGGNSNFPGLNKDDDIRAYNGNSITVNINPNLTIACVIIDYASGASYSEIYANDIKVTANMDGVYRINSDSFRIHANGGQVKMNSLDIFYRDATAQEKVERLDTQTELAYHYQKDGEGNFTYSDIVMRFGAQISKDLWNELDTDSHTITGFGVILMDGGVVKNEADVADAMTDMALSTVSEDLNTYLAIDYFVPIANMNEKIGSDANNYFWNLRVSVDESEMSKMYTAVAYVKVGDEYVLLNMARESVETLALDYLTYRNCDDTTAGGSLQNIVDKAA